MWKNVVILLVVSIYFSSCKNDSKFLNQVKNNEIEYVAEVIPKFHLKVETDTLLSNNFRVKIKYNSLNKRVLKITETPFIINKSFYREFESVLEVFDGNEIIFNKKLTKDDFQGPSNNKFWEKAILQFVEIDQLATQQNEKVVLAFLFFNPETQNKKLYNLYIDKKGNPETKLVV